LNGDSVAFLHVNDCVTLTPRSARRRRLHRGPRDAAGRIAASRPLKDSPLNTIPPLDPERLRIEPERPRDVIGIGQITTAAFAPMPFSDGDEARVIEALREAGALSVSLVATTADGERVGHIAFSPVRIDDRPSDWYGLGPVSVAPRMQRRGVGSALITTGLDRLRGLLAGGCVLLGSPDYYRRFGFVSDPTLTYRGQPNPYFQRLILRGPPARGDASFHPAFDAP
jgi:predicted N-acetyltransferase YhbS